jgi:hypothetical protein
MLRLFAQRGSHAFECQDGSRLLYPCLPGASGLAKGLSFGLVVWLFRVVMGVAGEWMMFAVPASTLWYKLASGLAEMLALGA